MTSNYQHKNIARYLEASDRMNAPVLLEDDISIMPVQEPCSFIMPYTIDLSEFDDTEEITISIANAGDGFLIVSSVTADTDWIKIDDTVPKKALEWSDGPMIINANINKKIPAGDYSGNIIIETKQEARTIHQIPIRLIIPKEDAISIFASADLLDFSSVTLHKEIEFAFRNSSAEVVYLQGDFTNWEQDRVPMTRIQDGFSVIISLADGDYLYQFNADGRDLPDPDNQQKIVIGEHGTCSRLAINRYTRSFEITNAGSRSVKVKLIPSSEWISLSEYEFSIGKREKKQIDVFLLTHLMNSGHNSLRVDILAKSRQIGSLTIQANGVAYGPVANVSPQQLILGEVFRGRDLSGVLRIGNVGKGILTGDILVEEPWFTPKKVEVLEGASIDISISVDSEQLPPGEYKANVTLTTNSCIHGTGKYNIPLEFQLIAMEIEPEEVDLGVMWVGEKKDQQIRARRSDGARMDITVSQDLPPWIEMTPGGRQALNMMVNWNGLHLQADQDLEAVVEVIDEQTQMRESVRVRGRVLIPHIAVDELNFGGGKWKKKTLTLPVRNMGNGKLIIHKVEIGENQSWISMKAKRKKNIPPMFLVTADRRFITKADRYNSISGVIRIFSNDPIEPVIDVFIVIGG